MLLFFVSFLHSEVKTTTKYHKEFYKTGVLKAEGWLKNNIKTGYWKYYYKNGVISEQGHYKNGKRENYWYFYTTNNIPTREGNFKNDKMISWWHFYDDKGVLNHKCQLENNIKNGYCLKYKNEKLTAAVKYSKGKRIKEWTSFSSFRKENKLSDLQ